MSETLVNQSMIIAIAIAIDIDMCVRVGVYAVNNKFFKKVINTTTEHRNHHKSKRLNLVY